MAPPDATSTIWDRVGAAGGILSLLFSIGGFALIGAAGFGLGPEPSRADVAEAVRDGQSGLALTGLYLDTIGSLFFIAFATRLWALLARAGSAPSWLPLAALVAAATAVTAGMGDKAAFYAIFTRADDGLAVDSATTLYDTASGFFALFRVFGGFFVLVASLAALSAVALPRWLSWVGLVVGAASILSGVAPNSDAAQLTFPLVALWIVAVSVVMLRRPLGQEQR